MPGQTGPKRTTHQRDADLELIAQWRVEGLTVRAITAKLNALRNQSDDGRGYTVTHQQIVADLKTVDRRWRESTNVDFAEARNRQLAELDHISAVAWAEWHRSREAFTSTTVEGLRVGAGEVPADPTEGLTERAQVLGETLGRARVSTRRETRLGASRYLEVILKAAERRAKLLGLDALDAERRRVLQRMAEQLAKEFDMTVDEVLAEADAILGQMRERP